MDNTELANTIVAAIRDPENLNSLSIHTVEMDISGSVVEVQVLAWLNLDFTLSPLLVFCTPEITEQLKLNNPQPEE